tara:strand:- start:73 stop:291 length:219 start_codon:yes stop_codon:yes gene_type:complete
MTNVITKWVAEHNSNATLINTVNITDKISTVDKELISEMVKDTLIDMGILIEGGMFDWNLSVDYDTEDYTGE